MTSEHQWLIVVRRGFGRSPEQLDGTLRPLLEEQFPGHAFSLRWADEVEVAHPGPGDRLAVFSAPGTEQSTAELQQDVQSYVDRVVRERFKRKALDRWANEGGAAGN